MLDLVTVARRLLETRKTVKTLEAQAAAEAPTHPIPVEALNPVDSARYLVHHAAMQILAWVLEIDLDHLLTPPNLLHIPEQPRRVTLHRIELGESISPSGARQMWLMEIPAHEDARDPGFSTDYWSCFLSDEQAHELYETLGDTLLPKPHVPPVATLGRLRTAGLAGMAPRTDPVTTPIATPIARPIVYQPDTEDGYIGQVIRRNNPPQPPTAALGARNPKRGA